MDNTKTEKTEKMDFDRTVLYSGAAHMNFLFDPAEYAAPDGFEDEGSFICICSWCRKGYPLDIRKGQFVSSHEWEGRGDLTCPLCGHDAAGETFSLWKNEYSSFPWFMGVKRAEDGRFRISCVRMRAYPVINRKTVARLYRVKEEDVLSIVYFPNARAVKATIVRPMPSGALGERDVYGAQQHAPLVGYTFDLPD